MATPNPQTVYTKTAKGILEVRNKSTRLARDVAIVLETVDGTASVEQLQARSPLGAPQLQHALTTLAADGYIKAVVSPAHAAPERDPTAVQFDSPATDAKLSIEIASHALAAAEAAKVAQQEGRAALEARLKAEAEGRARALAESRLAQEAEARAAADSAARAAQHARDQAEQEAASTSDPAVRAQAQTNARNAATTAMRARAEAQARAEAEERARGVVEEKKATEQRARDESEKHAEAERRAQSRVTAETRARDALQAQLEAAAAARASDDPEAHARLQAREAAATRAREDAELLAHEQGADVEAPAADLHFDDLAQKLTARVNAERRAREAAERKSRTDADEQAGGSGARQTFPPLELAPRNDVPPRNEAPAATAAAGGEALPSIDLGSTAGRGDIRHNTPEHVPSALERAMIEREARAESEARENGNAPSPATATTTPAAPAAAKPIITRTAGGGATVRAAPPTFEAPKKEAEAPEHTPTGASVPGLADEKGPFEERLNVDRTAHDVLAESAEDRRKREAATLTRQAADFRRQRREEELRRAAQAERDRKRRALTRGIVATAIGLPALGVLWLQFVPMNSYVPDAQAALSARLNQPTTIATLRYVLLPTPRLVLEGVRIGSAQAVHIDRIDARAWPTALVSGPLEFGTVDLTGVTIDPGMVAMLPAWTGGRSANTVQTSKLLLHDVKLGAPGSKAESLNGEVDLAANGTVNHAVLQNDKVKLDIAAQPSGGMRLALNATEWRPPLAPPVTFSFLTLEGVADKDRFSTTHLSGRVGGGEITGTLAARWDGPTIVGGDLKLQGVRIEDAMRDLAPNLKAKGALSANLRYAAQADSASRLLDRSMVEGTFTLTRGEIAGIDLARAVQLPGTPTGGRTAFGEIKGSVAINGNQYSYRNLQLTSGPLEATGFIDVGAGGRLNGRLDARMTARSAVVAHAVFTIGGTVKDPIVR